MNAEIVSRLQDSFQQQIPQGLLLSAAEASKLAAKARTKIAEQIRAKVVSELNHDIAFGFSRSQIELGSYAIDEMTNAELAEVVGPIWIELEKAGYEVEIEGTALCIVIPE